MELVRTTHRPVNSSEHGCVLADDTDDVGIDYPPSCDLASFTPIDDAEWAAFEARSDEDADLRDPGVDFDVEHEDVVVSTQKKCPEVHADSEFMDMTEKERRVPAKKVVEVDSREQPGVRGKHPWSCRTGQGLYDPGSDGSP